MPLLPFFALVPFVAGARLPAAQDSLKDKVVAMEREGLDALKTGDLKHFGEITADDAVFVDNHGPANKETVLKNVTNFTLLDYTMEDVHFVQISRNSGLIAYKLHEHGTSHGHEFQAQVYVSSVWKQQGGKWLCSFSQETAVAK